MSGQLCPHTQALRQSLLSGRAVKALAKPIRILAIEGHPVLREGLRAILTSQKDVALVALVANAEQAAAEFRRYQPDVILMDLQLPNDTSIGALLGLRQEFPEARVILLTTLQNDGDVRRAMRAGVSGVILFDRVSRDELLAVIRSVHAGRKHIPPELAVRLVEHLGEDDLTSRELDVLRLVRDGYRNKQIADQLAIAETTVNFHVKNILDKLRANHRTHALAIAVRRGLLCI
jgi:DNA-binding NarL/FixJ family response regulator